MSAVRRWTWPMVTPGSIGRGLAATGATGPWRRCDDVVMRTRLQAHIGWVPAPVMAGLGRHPAAVIATFVVVVFAAVFAAFLLLVRGVASDPDPALEAAQGMAHRLLNGRESIDVDAQGAGRYVLRVVYQAS